MGERRIAAFDFDGTITTRDTLLPFLARAFSEHIRFNPMPVVLAVMLVLAIDRVRGERRELTPVRSAV